MDRFLVFRFGDRLGDLNAITPDEIVAFLCHLKAGSHPRRLARVNRPRHGVTCIRVKLRRRKWTGWSFAATTLMFVGGETGRGCSGRDAA
jgi:hypothetical protein